MVLCLSLPTFFVPPCRAATVRWVGSSADWGDTKKWGGGAIPGQGDDVVIDTSNGTITVTIPQTVQVNSIQCQETLLLNGGAGVVTHFAGSAGNPPGIADGTGTPASFNGPTGLAVDGAGNGGYKEQYHPQGNAGRVGYHRRRHLAALDSHRRA